MTSPRREPADPGAVDALLRELETATRVRDVDDATTPASTRRACAARSPWER